MNPTPSSPAPATYTPGYRLPKQLMFVGSLLVFGFGVTQIWTPLRVLLTGERARAEVVRVVKEKPGVAPRVFTEDHALQGELEIRDRSFVFWNEFRLRTRSGATVELRGSVGSQLKPLFPLTDADGLPTTVLVCYDPAQPSHAIFPLVISTWLAPAVLILAGLGGAVIGGVLLYWAGRPIDLPLIGPAAGASGERQK
ncbi:hypothetical protein [Opitutus sp. ER46]|uniref:hypothetical protein n=1 Tax=Opitutus sp. ER46 TaxID=2161864 RepID=UPI000D325258|nr:hypothetical protein [Opitutus sp. ER46]PTX98424.1 hypothetical protein DB354_03910 [Opitutus sp. ER46]